MVKRAKPCKQCTNKNLVWYRHIHGNSVYYCVRCITTNCSATSGYFRSKAEALEDWNNNHSTKSNNKKQKMETIKDKQNTIQKNAINVICGRNPLANQTLRDWIKQHEVVPEVIPDFKIVGGLINNMTWYLSQDVDKTPCTMYIPFPEAAVHPLDQIDIAEKIVQLGVKTQATIVIVTHSVYMLDALEVNLALNSGNVRWCFWEAGETLHAINKDETNVIYQPMAEAFSKIENMRDD